MSRRTRARGTAPRGYGSLLLLHPSAWRREHGERIIGLLLEVHAQQGRSRPSAADRFGFALHGVRTRLRRLRPHRTPRRFNGAAVLAGFRPFDQENGMDPAGPPLSAGEQARANAAESSADGPMAQVSWGPIAFHG